MARETWVQSQVESYQSLACQRGFGDLFVYLELDIGIMVRVFVNGPGDLGSIPGRVITKSLLPAGIWWFICISRTGHWHNGKSVCQWPRRPGFILRSSHAKVLSVGGWIWWFICISRTGYWHNGKSFRQWLRRLGFNPRSSHTKDSKNGTWCLLA